jgi:hypothetical protein
MGSFKAEAETTGNIYEIVEYGSTVDASTKDSPGATIAGLSVLRTTSGSAVNDMGDGRFKIVQTGEIVRRVD